MAYLGSFWIDSMPLFLSKFLARSLLANYCSNTFEIFKVQSVVE